MRTQLTAQALTKSTCVIRGKSRYSDSRVGLPLLVRYGGAAAIDRCGGANAGQAHAAIASDRCAGRAGASPRGYRLTAAAGRAARFHGYRLDRCGGANAGKPTRLSPGPCGGANAGRFHAAIASTAAAGKREQAHAAITSDRCGGAASGQAHAAITPTAVVGQTRGPRGTPRTAAAGQPRGKPRGYHWTAAAGQRGASHAAIASTAVVGRARRHAAITLS